MRASKHGEWAMLAETEGIAQKSGEEQRLAGAREASILELAHRMSNRKG